MIDVTDNRTAVSGKFTDLAMGRASLEALYISLLAIRCANPAAMFAQPSWTYVRATNTFEFVVPHARRNQETVNGTQKE